MKKIVALVLSLVMVLGLATTAFAATASATLYVQSDADTAKDGWAVVAEDLDAPADLKTDAAYEYGQGGNLEYYTVEGVDYVAATAATGAYKLVYGNHAPIYLNTAANYKYDFQATVFTNVTSDDEECGKLLVGKKDVAKTYYVVENDDGDVVNFYVKAGANDTVSAVLLVGTELVKVANVGGLDKVVSHVWAGNAVNDKGVYTTVKCANCGKEATLYVNADAAGKDAVYVDGMGWITEAAAGYTAAGAVVDTDKVESAETFDAGIAMYVGMSVMAAAGSAVVLKKKD